jgi:hypothetical protein
MKFIAGILAIAFSIGLFSYAIRRRGRAGFIDTPWEPYVTILILASLAVGLLLAGSTVVELRNATS